MKVWDWFVEINYQGDERPIKLVGQSEKTVNDWYPNNIKQKIEGTEREVEQ